VWVSGVARHGTSNFFSASFFESGRTAVHFAAGAEVGADRDVDPSAASSALDCFVDASWEAFEQGAPVVHVVQTWVVVAAAVAVEEKLAWVADMETDVPHVRNEVEVEKTGSLSAVQAAYLDDLAEHEWGVLVANWVVGASVLVSPDYFDEEKVDVEEVAAVVEAYEAVVEEGWY